MPELVKATYHDLSVSFTEEAWFNATAIAEKYGKRVADWLETKDTQDYIAALAEILNVPKTALLKAKRGRYGGTWMHPRLGVPFYIRENPVCRNSRGDRGGEIDHA